MPHVQEPYLPDDTRRRHVHQAMQFYKRKLMTVDEFLAEPDVADDDAAAVAGNADADAANDDDEDIIDYGGNVDDGDDFNVDVFNSFNGEDIDILEEALASSESSLLTDLSSESSAAAEREGGDADDEREEGDGGDDERVEGGDGGDDEMEGGEGGDEREEGDGGDEREGEGDVGDDDREGVSQGASKKKRRKRGDYLSVTNKFRYLMLTCT